MTISENTQIIKLQCNAETQEYYDINRRLWIVKSKVIIKSARSLSLKTLRKMGSTSLLCNLHFNVFLSTIGCIYNNALFITDW